MSAAGSAVKQGCSDGSGIFSFPSSLLRNLGSVGLAMFYWVIGLLISLAGISVYLEFASYFPSRSGSEVVYLEQAYAKPKYFFPIAFAVQTVILSFVSSNVIGELRPSPRGASVDPQLLRSTSSG